MSFFESLRGLSPKHRAFKALAEHLKDSISFAVKSGHLEPLPPSPGSETTEWKTTPGKGVNAFYTIYTDIDEAIEQYSPGNAVLAEAGLLNEVKVDIASPCGETDLVRYRVGERWPPHIRQKILEDKEYNPFKSQKRSSVGHRYVLDHSVALMAKARRAPQRAGALVMRILGLARACGIYELNVADLAEMIANSTVYEQFARFYYAAVLGMDDIGHFGYRLPNGKHLGNMKTTTTSLNAPGGSVQIATIQNGHPVLTFPAPIEQLQNVKISVAKEAKAEGNEPVFMASGLATALSYRPRTQRERSMVRELGLEMAKELVPRSIGGKINSSQAQTARYDVHGNPLFQAKDAETIKLNVSRSSADQRLHANITQIGDFPWYYAPAGLFGTPCNCKPDAQKRVLSSGQFHGIPLRYIALYTAAKQDDLLVGHNTLQFHWATDDLPLIIALTNRLVIPTYVQGHGECVYCALQNAAGYGCTLIIGGAV